MLMRSCTCNDASCYWYAYFDYGVELKSKVVWRALVDTIGVDQTPPADEAWVPPVELTG